MKTIILRPFVVLLIALYTLCACSGDSAPGIIEPPVGGNPDAEWPADPDAPVQIKPVVTIPGSESTRAGGVIAPGAAIAASFFRADETFAANWAAVTSAISGNIATDGKVTFGTAQYYIGIKKTKFVGLYPAIGSGATWAPTTGTGTVTVPIDGYTDIMVTPIKECTRTAQPAMQFKHLLTQVRFDIIAEDATAIAQWGTINSVSVTGRANSCTILLPVPTAATNTEAATPTFSGSTALAARTLTGGTVSALTATTTNQTFGYCMFAPVTTSTALPLSVVTSKGGTVTLNVPTSQTYLAGTAYTVQLKLTATAIAATATIAAWITGAAIPTVTL